MGNVLSFHNQNSDEDSVNISVMRAVRKQYPVSLTFGTSRNAILTPYCEAGVHKSRVPAHLSN